MHSLVRTPETRSVKGVLTKECTPANALTDLKHRTQYNSSVHSEQRMHCIMFDLNPTRPKRYGPKYITHYPPYNRLLSSTEHTNYTMHDIFRYSHVMRSCSGTQCTVVADMVGYNDLDIKYLQCILEKLMHGYIHVTNQQSCFK